MVNGLSRCAVGTGSTAGGATALTLLLCSWVWGCSANDSPRPSKDSGLLGGVASGQPSSAARPEGSLSWKACGSLECATLSVPLDYAEPSGKMLRIAINRLRAKTKEPYRGVVFYNPGGPGAPGKPIVAEGGATLQQLIPGFDFIGFDPRGTGDSTAPTCNPKPPLDEAYAKGGVPAAIAAFGDAYQACQSEDGELLQHLGSNEVVADIDGIRVALGAEEINFLGVSYGTRLAGLYALKYPEHARGIVLDAVLPPTAELVRQVNGQFDAVLKAHSQMLAECKARKLDVDGHHCPKDPQAAFDKLLAAVDKVGVRAQLISNWALSLSSPAGRDSLVDLLEVADTTPDLEGLIRDSLTETGETNGFDVSAASNFSTNCSDNTEKPYSEAEYETQFASLRSRSPVFASQGLAMLSCAGWQVRPDPVPRLEFKARVPLMLIGGTQDTLTPLPWAEEVAKSIEGSHLLVSEHYGHGATAWGGKCVFDRVFKYLVDPGSLPDGVRCPAP